jgi:hypothetical protein
MPSLSSLSITTSRLRLALLDQSALDQPCDGILEMVTIPAR